MRSCADLEGAGRGRRYCTVLYCSATVMEVMQSCARP